MLPTKYKTGKSMSPILTRRKIRINYKIITFLESIRIEIVAQKSSLKSKKIWVCFKESWDTSTDLQW